MSLEICLNYVLQQLQDVVVQPGASTKMILACAETSSSCRECEDFSALNKTVLPTAVTKLTNLVCNIRFAINI